MHLQSGLQVVAAGVATHLYLRKFESQNPLSLASVLATQPALLHAILRPAPFSILSILATYFLFLTSLGLSIILYRLSPFHPLAKFRGPTINKISKLWSIWIQMGGHQHLVNKQLHDKYGPVVRVGPNELSIIDIDIALTILGPGGLPKGRYYEARQDPNAPGNLFALHGQAHTDRRRLWSRAFTHESMAEYEGALSRRVESLVESMATKSKASNGLVDLSRWLNYFSLDFMGDLCFGGGFELLRAGEDPEGILSMFEQFMVSLSLVCHVPWAALALQKLPFLTKNILKLRKFAVESATNRIKRGTTTKDLWYHLSDDAGLEKEQPPVRNVIADSALAMIAGSDTTATGLSSLFYYLLSHPECYKRLQAEIDNVYPRGESVLDTSNHAEVPYLTACINETLRLLPPTLTCGPREVPYGSGSRVIGQRDVVIPYHLNFVAYVTVYRSIPEGTQVYIPPYSIHRNPHHFAPRTEEFVPERWLPGWNNNESIHNTSAFIPFSFGHTNCVGRNLARREMTMVASAILQSFNLRFADKFDPSSWPDHLHDHFVTKRGALLVILSPRF